jgi:hypothetical protein
MSLQNIYIYIYVENNHSNNPEGPPLANRFISYFSLVNDISILNNDIFALLVPK